MCVLCAMPYIFCLSCLRHPSRLLVNLSSSIDTLWEKKIPAFCVVKTHNWHSLNPLNEEKKEKSDCMQHALFYCELTHAYSNSIHIKSLENKNTSEIMCFLNSGRQKAMISGCTFWFIHTTLNTERILRLQWTKIKASFSFNTKCQNESAKKESDC